MAVENIAAYHFTLEIQGVVVGFHLMTQEDGSLAWREGLAEKYAAQSRTQAFSYEHVPPDVDQPLAGEDWYGGAGYDTVRNAEGPVSTAKYSYSRGVNASYRNMLMLSHRVETVLKSDSTAIDAIPRVFYHSPTLGLFVGAGRYIYRFDVTSSTWVLVSSTEIDANIRSFREHDSVLYASTGALTDYYHTNNGTTWTEYVTENENADFFESRANVLWKVAANAIKNSLTPTIAGWTGSDKLGHASMTIEGLVQADGSLFAFYREGIFEYTGSAIRDLWRAPVVRTGNGVAPFLSGDGYIYVPYGGYLAKFDPSGQSPIEQVYPHTAINSNPEITGRVTAVAGDERFLYFAVKNGAGNTYIMKGNPAENEYHTWVYMGDIDVTALRWVAEGIAHLTNPALLVGTETPTAGIIILPRLGYTPNTDPNCRFETTGTLSGSNWDYGAQAFPKFLNRGNLAGKNITASNNVQLYYSIDGAANVNMFDIISDGYAGEDVSTKVEFNVVRPVVVLNSGTVYDTPVATGFALHATPNPPRKRAWNLTVMLANNMRLNDDGIDDQDVGWVKSMLQLAWNDRPKLTDRNGGTSFVIVRDMQGQGIKPITVGGEKRDVEVITLQLVEVTRLTVNSQMANYDQDAYNSGEVFGP